MWVLGISAGSPWVNLENFSCVQEVLNYKWDKTSFPLHIFISCFTSFHGESGFLPAHCLVEVAGLRGLRRGDTNRHGAVEELDLHTDIRAY